MSTNAQTAVIIKGVVTHTVHREYLLYQQINGWFTYIFWSKTGLHGLIKNLTTFYVCVYMCWGCVGVYVEKGDVGKLVIRKMWPKRSLEPRRATSIKCAHASKQSTAEDITIIITPLKLDLWFRLTNNIPFQASWLDHRYMFHTWPNSVVQHLQKNSYRHMLTIWIALRSHLSSHLLYFLNFISMLLNRVSFVSTVALDGPRMQILLTAVFHLYHLLLKIWRL